MFVRVLCLSLFWFALFCALSSFAIILKRKRKLVALLLSSHRCFVTLNALWHFLTVPWVGLQYVIVVFRDQTHLLFGFHVTPNTILSFLFPNIVYFLVNIWSFLYIWGFFLMSRYRIRNIFGGCEIKKKTGMADSPDILGGGG